MRKSKKSTPQYMVTQLCSDSAVLDYFRSLNSINSQKSMGYYIKSFVKTALDCCNFTSWEKLTDTVINNPINSNYLPVLQEISSESFLFFGEDKTNTINFTYFDNTFVVDGIYSHLRLISKNGEEKQSADVVRLES